METTKSNRLLIIASILTFISAAYLIAPILMPEFWNFTSLVFLSAGILNLFILLKLSKNSRKLAGNLSLGVFVLLLIYNFYNQGKPNLTTTLAIGCLFSPPLIAGILYLLSDRERRIHGNA